MSGAVVTAEHGTGTYRYQPRSAHSWRCGRSVPMVVSSPWPGMTIVSAGNLENRPSSERMMAPKSL